MTNPKKQSSEAAIREIRRRTRRKFSPEEKIRIVLEGLRGEESIADLCRREGIAANLYYRWSKDFLEAGKKQLVYVGKPTSPMTMSLQNGRIP
jgi:transposase